MIAPFATTIKIFTKITIKITFTIPLPTPLTIIILR